MEMRLREYQVYFENSGSLVTCARPRIGEIGKNMPFESFSQKPHYWILYRERRDLHFKVSKNRNNHWSAGYRIPYIARL
jgi:hypothetical protein